MANFCINKIVQAVMEKIWKVNQIGGQETNMGGYLLHRMTNQVIPGIIPTRSCLI